MATDAKVLNFEVKRVTICCLNVTFAVESLETLRNETTEVCVELMVQPHQQGQHQRVILGNLKAKETSINEIRQSFTNQYNK